MSEREALDVGLIDDCFLKSAARWAVIAPIEIGADHHGPRNKRRAITIIRGAVGMVEPIGEDGLIPMDIALDRHRVGIKEKLRGVAPLALLRRPRPMHTEPVALTSLNVREIRVPAETIHLAQTDTCFIPLIVEETELDVLGDFREDREVRSRPVEDRSERIGFAWPDLQLSH